MNRARALDLPIYEEQGELELRNFWNVPPSYATFNAPGVADGMMALDPRTGTIGDAFDAFEMMELCAPGFMAKPLGVHIQNGHARLLVERLDTNGTQGWMEHPDRKRTFGPPPAALHQMQALLRPEAFATTLRRGDENHPGATWRSFDFANAFGDRHLFLGPDNLFRLAFPSRLHEFKESISQVFVDAKTQPA